MRNMLFISGVLIAASVSGSALAQNALMLVVQNPGVAFIDGVQTWQTRADVYRAPQQLQQNAQDFATGRQSALGATPDVWQATALTGSSLQNALPGGLATPTAGALQTSLPTGLQTPIQGALGGAMPSIGGID